MTSPTQQAFERYPALASWIEKLGNSACLSLGEWMVFVGALNATITQAENRRPPVVSGEEEQTVFAGGIDRPATDLGQPESREATAGAALRPMSDAPRDGSPVLCLTHPDIYPRIRPGRDDLEPWNGRWTVMHHRGNAPDDWDPGWAMNAPVGHGGFPDDWFVGWRPLSSEAQRVGADGEAYAGTLPPDEPISSLIPPKATAWYCEFRPEGLAPYGHLTLKYRETEGAFSVTPLYAYPPKATAGGEVERVWEATKWHPHMPMLAHELSWSADWPADLLGFRDLFRCIVTASLSPEVQPIGSVKEYPERETSGQEVADQSELTRSGNHGGFQPIGSAGEAEGVET